MVPTAQAAPVETGKPRVLIVDDDRDFADSLAEMLETRGYQVFVAADEQQARTLLTAQAPPVALVDVRLGRDSGLRVISELRRLHPRLICVMMTAFAEVETAVEAFRSGACHYLRKPLEIDAVLTTLAHCFQKFRLMQEKEAAEAALQESERRFRTLAAISPVGIFRGDAAGRCHYVNDRFTEISGLTAAQAAAGWLQAVHPDDRPGVAAQWEAAAAQDRPFLCECRFLRPDGGLAWVVSQAARENDGRPEAGYVGTLTDITAIKLAERAVQQQADELLSIFDSVDEIIHVCDPATNELLFANEACRRRFGSRLARDPAGAAVRPCPVCAESPDRCSVAAQPQVWEHRSPLDDRWYRSIAKAIRWPDGRIVRYEMAIDLTSRKRAEDAVRLSERRFRTLVRNIPGVVYLCLNDARYTMLYLSENVREMVGIPAEEFIEDRVSFVELYHPADVKEISEEVEAALRERRQFTLHYRLRHANGEWRWVEERGQGLYDEDGALLYLEGTMFDITDRRLAEEHLARLARKIEDKNRELQSLVQATSHDLASPLLNIRGFSEQLGKSCRMLADLLRDASVPAGLREQLARTLHQDIPESLGFISAAVGRMDQLLDGLRRLSRLGRVALEIRRLDMNALLADVARAMEFQFQEAGAEIRLDDLPPCYGDATQIGQLFGNLLDNAVKYRDPRRPLIIEVSGHSDDAESLYAVKDNGRGIAPEHADRVFEIFARCHADPEIPGEGLGLAVARWIVGRHGGRIRVESVPGEGSTFLISLPGRERGSTPLPIAARST